MPINTVDGICSDNTPGIPIIVNTTSTQATTAGSAVAQPTQLGGDGNANGKNGAATDGDGGSGAEEDNVVNANSS